MDIGASSSKSNDAVEGSSHSTNGYIGADKPAPSKVCHVVAQLLHSRLIDFRSATFRRHPSGSTYSIQNSDHSNEKVIQLGREDNGIEQGYDYAIAIVNKHTGEAQYVPAKLVNFQATYSSDPDSLFGNRPSRQTDYMADNAGARETWADKRRALTSEFGSAKRLKTQDAAKRRQINDETLAIMMGSTFSSSNATKKEEDSNPLSISLIAQAESSVLPKANEEAKLPTEVYSPDIFLSEADVIAMKDDALAYFKRPKNEVVGEDCSELVLRSIGNVDGDERRACLALLLTTMVKCYKALFFFQMISKGARAKSSIFQNDWIALKFPEFVTTKVRELFFPGEFVKETPKSKSAKLNVNVAEKDKLLAYLLCLIIILDKETLSVPITPWAKELNVTEARMTKVLTALGCSVQTASVSEGLRLSTLRIGRLTGPPPKNTANKKFVRRR
uniref:RNA polymerase I associated factor, A49-like protein n=1 Tax=Ascaris lumbricoides TaxID=6252 RepID=A0A0M3I7J2_ASCLU